MDEERLIQQLEKLLGQQGKDITRLIAEFKGKVRSGALTTSQTQQAVKAFSDLAKNSKNLTDEQKNQIKDLKEFTKSVEKSTKVMAGLNSTVNKITGTLFSFRKLIRLADPVPPTNTILLILFFFKKEIPSIISFSSSA